MKNIIKPYNHVESVVYESVSTNREVFLQKTTVVWVGALLCCLLWGSAFPCIKIGYETFDIPASDTAAQILFAGLRFTLSGILAVTFGSLIHKKLLFPKRGSVKKITVLSMFQTVGQYLFFYIGLAHTTGVKASVIEGVNVFIAIIVSSLIFRMESLTTQKIIGCIIGFCGVVIVNVNGSGLDLNLSFSGEGFIFLSTVAYAFSSVLLKKYSAEENPVVLSGWQFVIGGIIMTVLGLLFGGNITHWSASGIAMLVYLAFISAAAYSLWSILLKHNPVSRIAVFGFMNPVFGVVLSAVLLQESGSIGVMSLAALMLVCAGIYIVNKKQFKKKRTEHHGQVK
ncbi:MAG: DMT family transporter [Oscillospiraceae bacterium]|nr:DMT family transporter [Oscillospiraceae bacterium]